MGCKECGKPKCNGKCGCKSPKVLQINNPAEYITFHKVSIPAAMGDSTTNPPKIGAYRNALVYYEADHTSWMYSTDGIPTLVTGEQGETGPQGPAGTITIGTTTTGETGADAEVENVGTPENAILNFTIPRGEQGDQGPQGEPGPQGYMNEQDVRDVIGTIIPEDFFTDTSETVSDEGTSIALNGTTNAVFKDIKLLGDTTQSGTPAPENPIAVKNVSGEQTLVISDGSQQSQIFALNLGKNLFDKTKQIVENYTYIANGDTLALAGCSLQEAYIPVEPNQAYTLSTLIDPSGVNDFRIFICEYDKEKNFIQRDSDGSPATSRTITTTTSTFYVRLCFSTVTIPSLMFEKGSTVTSYARYFEPIELYKLGNFQDYIYKSGNKWFLHKATGKAIFDGSENWSKSGRSNSTAFVGALSVVDKGINFNASQLTKADKFVKTNTTPMGVGAFDLTNSVGGSAQYLLVALDALSITTIGDFKAWLAANTVTIYYPLTIAVETEITEEPLIKQLESLSFANSYKSETQANVSGNLPAILYLEAFIDNWNGATAGLGEGIEQLIDAGKTANSRLGLLDNRKFIFLGDSYCEGYTPDGHIESWAVKLKNKMGLTDENCSIVYNGGWGFGYPNKWFSTVLDRLPADDTFTDIVVCGGYNDKQATYNEINAGIADFVRVRDEKFPNAHIHVGFIGATAFPWSRSPFKSKIIDYIRSANQYENCSYLGNVEYSLLRLYECFASDGYHPNDLGQRLISDNLHQALITGSADCKFPYFSMAVSPASTWTGSSNLSFIGCEVENGTTYIEYTNQAPINLTNSNQSSLVCDGQHWLEVGDITAGFVCGTTYKNVVVPVNVIMRHSADSSAKWGSFTGQLRFENKKVELAIVAGHETNGYLSLTGITNVQIFPFSGAFDSLFC